MRKRRTPAPGRAGPLLPYLDYFIVYILYEVLYTGIIHRNPQMAYIPPHRRGEESLPAASSSKGKNERSDNRRSRGWVKRWSTCQCSRSGSEHFSVYSDAHSVAKGSMGDASLLGSSRAFCAAFYHVEPTPEGDIPQACLNLECGGSVCARKTVICVARVQASVASDAAGDDAFEDIYVARYSVSIRAWVHKLLAHILHGRPSPDGMAARVGLPDEHRGDSDRRLTACVCDRARRIAGRAIASRTCMLRRLQCPTPRCPSRSMLSRIAAAGCYSI